MRDTSRDPYLVGAGIGIVLVAAYAIAGRGLGASGGFASLVAAATAAMVGNANAMAMPALDGYLSNGVTSPLDDWLVWELAGVTVGGFLSAWRSGSLRWTSERGPHVSLAVRAGSALAGGFVMGVGAKFARGCTSGQALTGGALLSVGSWIFIAVAFAAAYLFAPAARRLWS